MLGRLRAKGITGGRDLNRLRHIRHPLQSARVIVGHRRNAASDHLLALVIAFTAGAANAGAFFALGQYTSHMTGYLSQLADHLVIGGWWVALVAVAAILSFTAGAAFCTLLILWARRHLGRRQYALTIAVQGLFLVIFSTGGWFTGDLGRLWALSCLCFIMGMQNATITKVSGARIRATHVTGMVTDLGIGLGRAIFGRLIPESRIAANRRYMALLGQIVGMFFLGGLTGAFGYGALGFLFSLPLGGVLLALSLPSLWRFGRIHKRRLRQG